MRRKRCPEFQTIIVNLQIEKEDMHTTPINSESIEALKRILSTAHTAVLTCHISPDGDAMGSTLGFCRVLRNKGFNARVATPDTPPKHLTFLPGAEHVVSYSRNPAYVSQLITTADVVFSLDYNELKRVDQMAGAIAAAPGAKVMIDHHLHPADYPEVVISRPEESSTSILIYKVLKALGWLDSLDAEAAECLYTGMMTDTGNFSYNSNNPEIYTVVADLMRRGIDKDAIYRKVYYSATADRLRLNGYALSKKMTVFPDHRAALITLTREELNHYHYQKGDTEDLVNRPLTIADVTYSVFLREESDYIKVSTRSKGDFPVNRLCKEYFNGGGHLNAAGGEFYGTLEEAVATIERAMPEFDRFLPK